MAIVHRFVPVSTGYGRGCLAVLVPAPALEGVIGPHAAGVGIPGADGNEPPGRRCRLAGLVPPPALNGVIDSHAARVVVPGADGDKPPTWRFRLDKKKVPTPALEGVVGPYPTCVEIPRADRANCPAGGVACPCSFRPQHWRVLSIRTPQVCIPPALTEANCPAGGVAWALLVPPPALNGAGSPYPTRVGMSGADGDEPPTWRRGPAVPFRTPALNGAFLPDPAGVFTPGTDGDEPCLPAVSPGRTRSIPSTGRFHRPACRKYGAARHRRRSTAHLTVPEPGLQHPSISPATCVWPCITALPRGVRPQRSTVFDTVPWSNTVTLLDGVRTKRPDAAACFHGR